MRLTRCARRRCVGGPEARRDARGAGRLDQLHRAARGRRHGVSPPSGRLACPREATAAAASWQPWLASVLPHSFPGRALLGMRMAAECTPGRRESAKEGRAFTRLLRTPPPCLSCPVTGAAAAALYGLRAGGQDRAPYAGAQHARRDQECARGNDPAGLRRKQMRPSAHVRRRRITMTMTSASIDRSCCVRPV